MVDTCSLLDMQHMPPATLCNSIHSSAAISDCHTRQAMEALAAPLLSFCGAPLPFPISNRRNHSRRCHYRSAGAVSCGESCLSVMTIASRKNLVTSLKLNLTWLVHEQLREALPKAPACTNFLTFPSQKKNKGTR